MWQWISKLLRVGAEVMSPLATVAFLVLDATGMKEVALADKTIGWQWFALGAFVVFVGLVYWRVWHLHTENKRLRNARPEIALGEAIEHANAKLPPSTTQLQNGTPFSVYLDTVRLYRIPIHNSGGAASTVSVRLIDINPPAAPELLGITLHLCRDNPKDAISYKQSFPLSRGLTEYVDVIALKSRPPYECYVCNVALQHAIQKVQLNGNYTFTIGAYAGNYYKKRHYVVSVDTVEGKLSMA